MTTDDDVMVAPLWVRLSPSPTGLAAYVLIVCLALAAGLGAFVGAASIEDQVLLTIQARGDAESSFNWLLFAIVAAGGLVAAAAVWAGATVARAVHDATAG